jgi:hypothetical protein
MHRHRGLLTQKRILSLAYYWEVGTSGNLLKCCIISAGLWLYYLQISPFISMYQTAVGFISPVEFANEASHMQLSYGKIVTSQSCQKLPIFICVGEFMHPVYLIFQTALLELSRNSIEM